MLERGVEVSHEAIRRWTLTFGAEYACSFRRRCGRGSVKNLGVFAVRAHLRQRRAAEFDVVYPKLFNAPVHRSRLRVDHDNVRPRSARRQHGGKHVVGR